MCCAEVQVFVFWQLYIPWLLAGSWKVAQQNCSNFGSRMSKHQRLLGSGFTVITSDWDQVSLSAFRLFRESVRKSRPSRALSRRHRSLWRRTWRRRPITSAVSCHHKERMLRFIVQEVFQEDIVAHAAGLVPCRTLQKVHTGLKFRAHSVELSVKNLIL